MQCYMKDAMEGTDRSPTECIMDRLDLVLEPHSKVNSIISILQITGAQISSVTIQRSHTVNQQNGHDQNPRVSGSGPLFFTLELSSL